MKNNFIKISIVLLFLVSCGKPPVDSDPSFPGPITYNVPTEYYDKYKSQLDLITSDIVSLTGKHLIRFVPNDNNPKYENTKDALSHYNSTNEAWVYFKEDNDQFINLSDSALGMAYLGEPSNPTGVIVLNFSNPSWSWTGQNFRQTLSHEILHCLGFNHTFDDDYSIMNSNYKREIIGLTDLDTQRLAENFPFSMEIVTIKDLEKIGAAKENIDSNKYAIFLVENYGLSENRAQTISKYLLSYRKLANMRDLNAREKDLLTHEILGFGFKRGKEALEKHLQGDQNSLDDLILEAAEKNETSPEHVKELFGEIFLN